MDSIDFDTFNSPANGVEFTDTLDTFRKKTNGIIEKIDAISSGDISDGSIVLEKIEDIGAKKVIGNITSSPASPSEIDILDEDDMASNSSNALVTQQSAKAYINSKAEEVNFYESSDKYIHSSHIFYRSAGSILVNDDYLLNAGDGDYMRYGGIGVAYRTSDGGYIFGRIGSHNNSSPNADLYVMTGYDSCTYNGVEYSINTTSPLERTVLTSDTIKDIYGTYNNDDVTPNGFRKIILTENDSTYLYCWRIEERSHTDLAYRATYWFGDHIDGTAKTAARSVTQFGTTFAKYQDTQLINDGDYSSYSAQYYAPLINWDTRSVLYADIRNNYGVCSYSLNNTYKERFIAFNDYAWNIFTRLSKLAEVIPS